MGNPGRADSHSIKTPSSRAGATSVARRIRVEGSLRLPSSRFRSLSFCKQFPGVGKVIVTAIGAGFLTGQRH